MQMSRKLRSLAAVVVLAMLTPMARAEVADVLQQAPADAPIVVAVPNLGALSQKLAKLDQQLGLGQPVLANLLAFVKGLSGLQQGINDQGGAALVFTAVPTPDQDKPQAYLLVPVTDYKAFMGNFPNAGAGDVASVQFAGEPGFVKQAGKYALLGPQQDIVTNAKIGGGNMAQRSGKLGSNTLAGSDAVIYLDLTKIGPAISPMVEAGLAQAAAQIDANPALGPNAEMARTMVNLYGDAIRALLRDGDSLVIGLQLSDAGIGFTESAQFKAGSPLAKSFANAPKSEPTFDRLPGRPFMLSVAMDNDALPVRDLVKSFAARFGPETPLGSLIGPAMKLMDKIGHQTQQAIYPPNLGGATPSLFTSVAVYDSPAPQELRASYADYIRSLANVKLGEGTGYKSDYKEAAKDVAGKKADSFTLQVTMPPEAMAQMGPLGGLFLQPMNGNIIALDKQVVITSGADDALLQEAVKAAGGGGDLATKTAGLQDVRKALPPHRAVEAYIGVGTIMQMANSLLVMFAPGMALNVPADLPPVATSVSVAEGGANAHFYVPMPVIVAIKNTIQQFQPGGAGGVGPGARGAAPAAPAAPLSPKVGTASDADFDALLKSDKPVVIEFWATWLPACGQQGAVSSAIADSMDNVKVVRIDVDKNPKAVDSQKVEELPTVLVIKGGKVQKFTGPTPKEKITAALQ
jgi:thioredoxin 1